MQPQGRGALLRSLCLVLAGVAAVSGTGWLAAPAGGTAAAVLRGRAEAPGFPALVELAAAGIAVASAGWLMVASLVMLADVLRPSRLGGGRARPRLLQPRWLRGLVLGGAALGTVLTAGPASADTVSGAARGIVSAGDVAGLPVPDRPAGGPATGAPGTRTASAAKVVVRPGDSLWEVACDALPPGAAASDVAEATRLLHAANHAVIGPDPDLIMPGMVLDLSVLATSSPGKERR